MARSTTDQTTHGSHPGEDPSQVGASYQEEEASSLEEGNQDQGERGDGLWKVLDGWVAETQD